MLNNIINENDEKEYIEFKTNYYVEKHYHEIGEYISALSNSATLHHQSFSYMIFGVENDKRHIVGTDFKYDVDIKNEGVFKHYLARNLSPRIVFEFEEEYIDGKRIVVLKIPAAKSVITEFDKERYIRIGSSKEILRKFPNHEAKLWKILNNDEYLLENDRSPNQKLSFRIFKIYLEDYNIDFNQNNFYENHHMLTETGQFNFIAYMFSDQFDMSFKVVKYSGSDKKSDFIYRKELAVDVF